MKSVLALLNRKKNQPSCCPFFVTTDSLRAIFLIPKPSACKSSSKSKHGLRATFKNPKIMSARLRDSAIAFLNSLTTSSCINPLFTTICNYYFLNITGKMNKSNFVIGNTNRKNEEREDADTCNIRTILLPSLTNLPVIGKEVTWF